MRGGRFFTLESKFTEHPHDAASLKRIEALRRYYGDKSLISAYVASRTSTPYPLSGKVKVVPGGLIDQFLTTG